MGFEIGKKKKSLSLTRKVSFQRELYFEFSLLPTSSVTLVFFGTLAKDRGWGDPSIPTKSEGRALG